MSKRAVERRTAGSSLCWSGSVLSTRAVAYTVRVDVSSAGEGIGRTRRARGSLSRELILDAAEAVAQQGGFDALTLRAVAERLQAAPMALYRHFATKEELVNALLDRVLGRFVLQEL